MADRDIGTVRAIGDALRAMRVRRTRLRRRVLAIGGLTAALLSTMVVPVRPRLLWNASASMPTGLYTVGSPHDLVTDDVVVARLPPAWAALADLRHYVPATIPVVKRIAATPGDVVCAVGRGIFINGRWRADRRAADAAGRVMRWWQGCIALRDGAIFLLADNPNSFDGRYIGPTARADVLGRAHPLWTR